MAANEQQRPFRLVPQSEWLTSQQDVWTGGQCLYVIEEDGSEFVKVGIAIQPARRLSTLQCGNPRQIKFALLLEADRPTCLRAEGEILKRLCEHRVRGEWLRATVEQVRAVLCDMGVKIP